MFSDNVCIHIRAHSKEKRLKVLCEEGIRIHWSGIVYEFLMDIQKKIPDDDLSAFRFVHPFMDSSLPGYCS